MLTLSIGADLRRELEMEGRRRQIPMSAVARDWLTAAMATPSIRGTYAPATSIFRPKAFYK